MLLVRVVDRWGILWFIHVFTFRGQRSKSTASRLQAECKRSCEPELMMSDEDTEETRSRSASLWLILVKLRHALLKMTLFQCKMVLKAAELQRNISLAQGRLIFQLQFQSIMSVRVIKRTGSAAWYTTPERRPRTQRLRGWQDGYRLLRSFLRLPAAGAAALCVTDNSSSGLICPHIKSDFTRFCMLPAGWNIHISFILSLHMRLNTCHKK